MDYSLPGSSVHGIFQARILEWVSISFSRGSFRPRDQTHISCISRWILYHWAPREAPPKLVSVSTERQKRQRKRERERREGGKEGEKKGRKKGGKKVRIYFFAHCFLNDISSASFYISTCMFHFLPSLTYFHPSIHASKYLPNLCKQCGLNSFASFLIQFLIH